MPEHMPRGDASQPFIENLVDATSSLHATALFVLQQIMDDIRKIARRRPGKRI